MPIALLADNPAGSQELYDSVWALLGRDENPAGRLVHVAGPSPSGGWRVVEVWESQEDADRFYQERLVPTLQSVGVTRRPQPEIWSVHSCMT